MNAEKSNTTQAVNDRKGNNNYSTDNPVAQTVQNGLKRPGDGKCFGIIFSKAKAQGKDEEIRYRVRNQDATGTGNIQTKNARAVNADETSHPSFGPPKKRDVADWASRIVNFLTPARSTARFEVTPEVNRSGRFSRYRSSRDRSKS